jgi:hypothetical protein
MTYYIRSPNDTTNPRDINPSDIGPSDVLYLWPRLNDKGLNDIDLDPNDRGWRM